MEGMKCKSSGRALPDGHATGLLGLPAVLDRLNDPSHRCQGPELTCLLQALCKQLINAASDTNLVIFTSADRSRAAAAQAAATDVEAELSIGAPDRCITSPQPFSSGFGSSYHARTNTDIEAPTSSQTVPTTAASTNSTPVALAPVQQPLNRPAAAAAAASARAEAAAARRPPAGPSKAAAQVVAAGTTAPAAPTGAVAGSKQLPPTAGTNSTAGAAAAAALAGLSPAAKDPTEGLAGMVTVGIALLVDHLEHFHYRAKAVALEGLLSLSAVGLGPDRRLDPAGISSLPLPAAGGSAAPTSSSAAAAAAVAAAAAMAAAGGAADSSWSCEDPTAVADAVQALGGLGLGDWLALRIIGAGAVPRLLEMLTQRTGMNFVPVRQLASQVVHNLARRRNAAVRTALARWRPLPGLISGLDVVLEDSPEIAARLLLVLSDLFPITCHQIAGALHKLIAKYQPPQLEQAAAQPAAAAPPLPPPQPAAQVDQQQGQPPQQQQVVQQPAGKQAANDQGADAKAGGAATSAAGQKARAGAVAEPQPVPARGRKLKAAAPAVEPPAAPSRGGAAPVGRPRRGAAAVAPAPPPAEGAAAAAAAAAARNPPVVAPEPAAAVAPPPAPATTVPADSTTTTHLGLAPDVDVPLEALLMRVTGYYMRLAYNAVHAPTSLPQPAGVKPPYGEAERRECEKALLTQRVEEHRRRRKEAGQLDCCVAALLAAAPMPSCFFDALSYSYTRAFSALSGQPSTSLTATINGGLWRAQDLLPYALNLLQSLGGGSDSGDGGSAAAAARIIGGAAASGSTSTAPAAANLLLPSLQSAVGSGAAAGTLSRGISPSVSAALDRFWGLEHPRCVSQSPSGVTISECQGPAFPSAPYGDKPVTASLMEHCGPVLQSILERAIQAADSLPLAAVAAAGSAAASGAAAPAVPAAVEMLAARAEALPLAVLRCVGSTFLSINRAQVAQRILSFTDGLECLTARLTRRTGGAAASVAQARMALGLASLWVCAAAGFGAPAAGQRPPQPRLENKAGRESGGDAAAGSREASAEPAVAAEATTAAEQPPEDGAAAQPPLRRSARIKRRREGTGRAAQAQAADPAPQGKDAGGPVSQPGSLAKTPGDPSTAAAPEGRAGSDGGAERTPGGAADATAAEGPKLSPGYVQLLESIVDMLAVRFADARQLQDSLDLQLRLQKEQRPQRPEDTDAAAANTSALAGPLNAAAVAAASGAAGSWLAAVTSAAAAITATSPADRVMLVVETQAMLLQAVALLMPALDSSQVSRLVEAGAVHAAARVFRAAAATAAPTAAASSPAADAAAVVTPDASPVGGAGAAAAGGSAAGPGSREEGRETLSGEPLHGITAAQALGLLVQLLRQSGPTSYGCGGLQQQPEALAALGGLLLLQRPAARCGGGLSLQPSAPVQEAEAAAGDLGERSADDPTSRSWELMMIMSAGLQPCAGHDVVLQLLCPLAALTHGSSARCAAARTSLMSVLQQVLQWSHSKTQRRRLMVQVLALWGPHLQGLLLRLPRMASPGPAPRAALPPLATAAAAAAAVVAAVEAPLGITIGAETKAAAAAAAGCNLGRTSSQSTMPYQGSRGGRYSTPMNSIHGQGQGALHTGGSSAAIAHPGQRTPPWGGCGAAAAAAAAAAGSGSVATSAVHAAAAAGASQLISPTRHTTSVSGLRTAVPPAPNPLRGRRGSRLATALSSPVPLPAPRGAALQGDGDVGMGGAVLGAGPLAAVAAAGADMQTSSAMLEPLCVLLEVVMKQMPDCEVVRHLHATGWLRALCHGAHSLEAPVREPCLRAMTSVARVLAVGGRTAPVLFLADLEADAEVRNQLCSLNPGAAAVLARRQEALPPRVPEGMPPRAVVAAAGGRLGRSGLPQASDVSRMAPSGDCGAAVPLLRASSLPHQLSSGKLEAVALANQKGGVKAARPPARAASSPAHADRDESSALQIPTALELVLAPPPEDEQPVARKGRRRGAVASKVAGRARKGLRPAGAGPRGAAAPVPGEEVNEATAEVNEADDEAGPPVGAEAAVPRRTRARKGTARRKVRAAKDAKEASSAEPATEDAGPALEDNAATSAVAAAAAAPGPGPLVSPLPKRRRISELEGGDDDEHRGSAVVGGAAAAADGTAVGSVRARTALFPAAAAGASFSAPALDVTSGGGLSSGLTAGIHESGTSKAAGRTAEVAGGQAHEAMAAAARLQPSTSAAPSLDRDATLDLQLTARELRLAEAVRCACVSLESALAARRHDLAAVRAADQAAAAAAAAAATMAVAAAAVAPETAGLDGAPVEDASTAQGGGAKKKLGRTRTGAGTAPAARSGAQGKQQAQAAAAAAAGAAAPQQAAPPAPLVQQQAPTGRPNAVADEEFLNRTYRGVSKRLNFDDL